MDDGAALKVCAALSPDYHSSCKEYTDRRSHDAASTASTLGDLDKLPGEIRNEIYKLLLIAQSPITVQRHKSYSLYQYKASWKVSGTVRPVSAKGKRQRRTACGNAIELQVLRVSKSVCVEAAPLFYKCNSFVFSHYTALQKFLFRINEMAFFLADVEVVNNNQSSPKNFEKILKKMRVCSNPKRIAFRVPCRTSWTQGMVLARTTWEMIKAFVKRKGGDYFNSRALAGVRSHMHTGFHGLLPKCSYAALTKGAQLERLNAFCFEVPKMVALEEPGSGKEVVFDDPAERTRRFKALVVDCWREELTTEQELEEEQWESEIDEDSESESDEDVKS